MNADKLVEAIRDLVRGSTERERELELKLRQTTDRVRDLVRGSTERERELELKLRQATDRAEKLEAEFRRVAETLGIERWEL